MGKVTVQIEGQGSLLEMCRNQGFYVDSPCAGTGNCGKCRIRFYSNPPKVQLREREVFTEEALRQGWRLACLQYPARENLLGEVEIELPEEEEIQAEATVQEQTQGVAIDIGTTTIAFQKGEKVWTIGNPQRAWGQDVLSRIAAASNAKEAQAMQAAVIEVLFTGIEQVAGEEVTLVAIAGNTTMMHLLLGYKVASLGHAPFEPLCLEYPVHPLSWYGAQIGRSVKNQAPVYLLPGYSTFVGGDLSAGWYTLSMGQLGKTEMLVDLGTNGEMLLSKDGICYMTSTAAGPAFEGGNISQGVPGIEGAIAHVTIRDGRAYCQTIGGKRAIGICGSGVLETGAEMRRNRLVDVQGNFKRPYLETGMELEEQVFFQQKDMRQLQTAKAAIRTGMELLMREAKVSPEEVHTVYLAGGFSKEFQTRKAVMLGLFPKVFENKVKIVGNTALSGAAKFLNCQGWREEERPKMHPVTKEVVLSEHPQFQELFFTYMNFEQ